MMQYGIHMTRTHSGLFSWLAKSSFQYYKSVEHKVDARAENHSDVDFSTKEKKKSTMSIPRHVIRYYDPRSRTTAIPCPPPIHAAPTTYL